MLTFIHPDPAIIWRGFLFNITKVLSTFDNTFENHNTRENITDGWKWELAQTKKNILEAKGRETQGIRTDLLSTVDKKLEQPHNTQNEIAKDLGNRSGWDFTPI